ncbi:imm11 family protein [Thalassolituus marinus]|uniref:Immunity MXAN-0049 protein domain-containing protein n=1 Tax=Thalassolituus marinus TaxID=671053 RepID=A0ABS7ZV86_9GAMM|nr:DUF1629 domain-containing protein [Thalassolituus marinus]MCA6064325.1 hypothetical protein [Thalassolituus marinus]
MTTFRLLNNVKSYHEAFIDFRAMRKQLDDVKVWFSQKNETLLNRLKSEWKPVSVTFESDKKTNKIPDISVWNYSCLVLSDRAKIALESILKNTGEFLPLEDGCWLFNCLDTIDGTSIEANGSKFKIDTEESLHIPETLNLRPEKISGKVLFKPGFAHNSFLICSAEFKDTATREELGGITFEEDLAKIFL